MEKNLKKSVERAKIYLKIVETIETYKKCSKEGIDWLLSNSPRLQKEVARFGYGIIGYRLPFGQGYIPEYQVLANFPILLEGNFPQDGLQLIPIVKQILFGYIQEVEELLQTPDKLNDKKIEPDFFKIIKDISDNFRKIVIKEPQNEKDIQDYLEGFLSVKRYDFKRETESSSFSTKSFIPDFTNEKFKIAIEVKFIDSKSKVKKCIEDMSADIKPYSKRWNKILFLVYDKGGNINDIDEFTKDFIQIGKLTTNCLVIKH